MDVTPNLANWLIIIAEMLKTTRKISVLPNVHRNMEVGI